MCLLFLYPGLRKSLKRNKSNRINTNPFLPYTKIFLYWNTCYNWLIIYYMKLSIYLSRFFDRGILQFIGPIGIYKLLDNIAIRLESNFTNYLLHYFSQIIILCVLMIITSNFVFIILGIY